MRPVSVTVRAESGPVRPPTPIRHDRVPHPREALPCDYPYVTCKRLSDDQNQRWCPNTVVKWQTCGQMAQMCKSPWPFP